MKHGMCSDQCKKETELVDGEQIFHVSIENPLASYIFLNIYLIGQLKWFSIVHIIMIDIWNIKHDFIQISMAIPFYRQLWIIFLEKFIFSIAK